MTNKTEGTKEGTTPASAVPAERDWRLAAANWLRMKAAEQQATNAAYPAHAEAYQSWRHRVDDRMRMAEELELLSQAFPNGLDAGHSPVDPGVAQDAARWQHASNSRNFGITAWGEFGQRTVYGDLAAKLVDTSMSSPVEPNHGATEKKGTQP